MILIFDLSVRGEYSCPVSSAGGCEQTRRLSGEERLSLLEELRYDLAEMTGYDYS
jgi:hypothetical protein